MPLRALSVGLASCLVIACSAADSGPDDGPVSNDAGSRVRPTHLEAHLLAEESRADAGWAGFGAGQSLPIGATITLEVTECDSEGRWCEFRGPVRADPAHDPVVSQRCVGDIALTCGDDAECGGAGPCRFMLPPSELHFAAFCSVVYFEPIADDEDPSPVRGVFDLATGDMRFEALNARWAINTTAGCTSCLGDDVARDGQRNGACGGAGGAACDVAGITAEPAATTSFDCAPASFGALAVAVPARGISTVPTLWTMDETRPSCTRVDSRSERCWCGVCAGDAQPCSADSQCASGACGWPGPLGDLLPTYVTAPDGCAFYSPCDWDEETQRGTCASALNGQSVECFPRSGTIRVDGSAMALEDSYLSTLGLISCLPASGSALIDPVIGLPGPLYFQNRFQIYPRVR